jgi:hypothetical protein
MDPFVKRYVERLQVIYLITIVPLLIVLITKNIWVSYFIPTIILLYWGYKKIKNGRENNT